MKTSGSIMPEPRISSQPVPLADPAALAAQITQAISTSALAR